MRVFHVTAARNSGSIEARGIDPQYSRGKRRECWFVKAGKVAWAMLHVSKRHNVPVDEVVALELQVNRSTLTNRGGGKFSSAAVIPPICISDSYTVDDVAGSIPFKHERDEEHTSR